MHFDLIAFYGGPDQVMTVTSGIASAIGVVLIFWNKLVAAVMRLFHRPSSTPAQKAPEAQAPPQNPS
jgi:hypothetical protein